MEFSDDIVDGLEHLHTFYVADKTLSTHSCKRLSDHFPFRGRFFVDPNKVYVTYYDDIIYFMVLWFSNLYIAEASVDIFLIP